MEAESGPVSSKRCGVVHSAPPNGTRNEKKPLCGQTTSEERVVLEVLDAVLAQAVLSAADESTDQVLGLL